MKSFDVHRFKYVILKHKYLELLTIKAEHNQTSGEFSVDEIVKCLKEIEEIASSKEEFRDLCLLLTLPRLTDHADYRYGLWSSHNVGCWGVEVLELGSIMFLQRLTSVVAIGWF